MFSRALARCLPPVLAALTAGACAPAMPLWSGGTTTPRGRGDVAAGASFRVPTGALAKADAASAPSRVARGGVAPAAQVRHGISDTVDVGLTVSGPAARVDVRAGFELDRGGTTIYSFLPAAGVHAGVVDDERKGRAGWFGADLPLLFGASYGSLVELYAGPRLGLEHFWGEALGAGSPVEALALRAGGTVGVGTGFRGHLALLELTAQHEWWRGEVGARAMSRRGFALIPSFALRIRL